MDNILFLEAEMKMADEIKVIKHHYVIKSDLPWMSFQEGRIHTGRIIIVGNTYFQDQQIPQEEEKWKVKDEEPLNLEPGDIIGFSLGDPFFRFSIITYDSIDYILLPQRLIRYVIPERSQKK